MSVTVGGWLFVGMGVVGNTVECKWCDENDFVCTSMKNKMAHIQFKCISAFMLFHDLSDTGNESCRHVAQHLCILFEITLSL